MPNQVSPHSVPQSEHRNILAEIDFYYGETCKASAWLQRYLIIKIGPMRDPFLYFFENFITLFTMTHKHKEMGTAKEVSEKILKWRNGTEITPARCKKGIELFDDWQEALFKAGLLSVRK